MQITGLEKADATYLIKTGTRISCQFGVLYFQKAKVLRVGGQEKTAKTAHVAVSCAKKYFKTAVARNLIKRQLRSFVYRGDVAGKFFFIVNKNYDAGKYEKYWNEYNRKLEKALKQCPTL